MPSYVVMKDDEPPSKPTGLEGIIDTSGIVKIWWPKGSEPDLNGYRVYYSNHKNSEFHALTGTFRDTVFTDTINLNTLDELIYYRIVAVDLNLNNSEFSDILELQKPDKVKPVAPVFRTYEISDTSVFLAWIPGTSRDISKQILYKRESGLDWKEYKEFNKEVSSYTDSDVNKEKIYEYSLVAIDDAGLSSDMSKPITVRVYNAGILNKVKGLKAAVNENGNSVVLNWNSSGDTQCSYLIYRSYNNNGLQMCAKINGGSNNYTDENVTPGASYSYAIKVVNKDGKKSLLSKPVVVKL